MLRLRREIQDIQDTACDDKDCWWARDHRGEEGYGSDAADAEDERDQGECREHPAEQDYLPFIENAAESDRYGLLSALSYQVWALYDLFPNII